MKRVSGAMSAFGEKPTLTALKGVPAKLLGRLPRQG